MHHKGPLVRQKIRATVASQRNDCGNSSYAGAEILWDLRKAFEHVCRSRLWEVARCSEYPLVVLRASLRAYSWKKRIVLEGNTRSRELASLSGVGAGAAFAVRELKMYLASYSKVAKSFGLRIATHVDDSAIEATGETEHEAHHRLELGIPALKEELKKIKTPLADEKEEIWRLPEG